MKTFERIKKGISALLLGVMIVTSPAQAAELLPEAAGQTPVAIKTAGHEFTAQAAKDARFEDPDRPLSVPSITPRKAANESRDLPEYDFDLALAHLNKDYASAVIVTKLAAKDLRRLAGLSFEVGIAVVKGKIVLFTSGAEGEIRLNPAAAKLLDKASLIAHTHPKGSRTKPSLTDFEEAGKKTEYLVSEDGVYAYNRKGLVSDYPLDYGTFARKINGQAKTGSTKATRDLLNAFILEVDKINKEAETALLFRAADPVTVLTGQPVVGASTAGGAYGTVDYYAANLIRLNYDISTPGSSARAKLTFPAPQNFNALPKFTFEIRLPTMNCQTSTCVVIEFRDAAGRVAAVPIAGLALDFRQVDVTRTQILAANSAFDLTRMAGIDFRVQYGTGITHIANMEIKTAGYSLAPQTSPEGYRVLSLDSSSRTRTTMTGQPVLSSGALNGGSVTLRQTSEESFDLNFQLPAADSVAWGSITLASPQNFGTAPVFYAHGYPNAGRQVRVQVFDAAGRVATYLLNQSYSGTYTIDLAGSAIPAGFDTTRISEFRFLLDRSRMGASGSMTIGTSGLNYVPAVQPGAYNPATLTGLPDHPIVRAGSGSGTIAIQQASGREFSFNYGLPGANDTVAAEIAWGQFTVTGTFDGRPAVCGAGGSPIVFAVSGAAGAKIRAEIVDANGKVADFLLPLTGGKANFVLPTNGAAYPAGFDITRVALIRFVGNRSELGASGTIAVEAGGGLWYAPNSIPASTLTPSQIQPLPTNNVMQGSTLMPAVTFVAPTGAIATGGSPARGSYFHFETKTAGWAGTGFTYDNFSTPGIETGNLAGRSQLQFGIQGTVGSVKLEVIDDQNRKAVVYLNGILAGSEKVWSVPTSALTGIDLSKVRMMYFIVEGPNLTGNLEINQYPLGTSYPRYYQSSAEITPLPGNPTNNTVVPAGATGTMAATARGGVLTYNTGTAGWVGGGFNYDNFGTPAIETANLSTMNKLVFGLKGTPPRVKLEVIDDQNRKATVYLLQTNFNGEENEWEVSTADLAASGLDLTKVRMIYFIVEGANQTGTLEINRVPSGLQPALMWGPHNITKLPGAPQNNTVAPAGATSTATGTARGVSLAYNTGAPGWSGGGFVYDNFGTTAIETADLSRYDELVFGLKGNAAVVKLEVIDDQNRKATIKLTGVSASEEKAWLIPASMLTSQGVNLAKVRMIYFIVEGANQTGTLEVNRFPTPIPPNVSPYRATQTFPFTPLDITNLERAKGTTVVPAGATGANALTDRGLRFSYNTGTAGWSGTGLNFDDPATPAVESEYLAGLSAIVIGLKGNASQVKVEVVDATGAKAFVYLTGIRADLEQFWAMPINAFKGTVDMTRIAKIYFIVEGANQAGALDVNHFPSHGAFPTNAHLAVYQQYGYGDAMPNQYFPVPEQFVKVTNTTTGAVSYRRIFGGESGGGFNLSNVKAASPNGVDGVAKYLLVAWGSDVYVADDNLNQRARRLVLPSPLLSASFESLTVARLLLANGKRYRLNVVTLELVEIV